MHNDFRTKSRISSTKEGDDLHNYEETGRDWQFLELRSGGRFEPNWGRRQAEKGYFNRIILPVLDTPATSIR